MIGHSLLADHDHHRLVRRVTAPAFSRNVVDNIQAKIEPEVKKLFDRLGQPETFDYIEEIAAHIPFISITRMVGIPEKYWPEIQYRSAATRKNLRPRARTAIAPSRSLRR